MSANMPLFSVDNVLPDEPLRRRSASAASSPGPSTPQLGTTLLPGVVPMQRLITPIHEDDKQDSAAASPVSARAVSISIPLHRDKDDHKNHELENREQRLRTMSEGRQMSGGETTTSSGTSRTGSSDANSEPEPYVDGPGRFEELERFESPLPADEVIAQRKNESRYRFFLRHSYNFSRKQASYNVWN